MLDETTVQLVRHLEHANGWWRDTAQKLIILRPDRDTVVPLLEGMARFSQNPLARLHALWTLEGIDALERSVVVERYADRDPRVRRAAIQIAERWVDETETLDGFAVLAGDPDEKVAQQLVLTLGMSRGENRKRAEELAQKAARRHLKSRGMMLAAGVALWGGKDLPLVGDIEAENGVEPAVAAQWKTVLANWSGGWSSPRAWIAITSGRSGTAMNLVRACIAGNDQPGPVAMLVEPQLPVRACRIVPLVEIVVEPLRRIGGLVVGSMDKSGVAEVGELRSIARPQ